MSSGWSGPGARGAPQNQQDNASYAALKAQVEHDEQKRREAEDARRASEGLPPVRDGVLSKVKKAVLKVFMM